MRVRDKNKIKQKESIRVNATTGKKKPPLEGPFEASLWARLKIYIKHFCILENNINFAK